MAPPPAGTFREGSGPGEIPVPDDAALRRIAGKVSRASEQMDKVESAAAERILEEAEKECRSYRFTEATRPFLAEIFLRRGILRLWEEGVRRRGAPFPRPGVASGLHPRTRPCFPQVLSVWEAIRRRPVPEAELLVESLPSGAEIFVDGERRGVTPARVRTKNIAPVRIRVSHPGYRDAETTGQWLPGDTEILRFSLPGDRVARLGELLAGAAQGRAEARAPGRGTLRGGGDLAGGDPDARKGSARRGAARTTLCRETGEPGSGTPREKTFPEGKRGAEISGKWVAETLAADGWPRAEPPEKLWYYSYWFWGFVLSAAGLAAALGGGGGGSSGASGGTVAVTF